MSVPRWAVFSTVTLLLLVVAFTDVSHAAPSCPGPREMPRFAVGLPNPAGAIGSGKTLIIVAIGSSSTRGVGASNPAHTYPALLNEDLQRRWPQLAVTVVNKGVSGEIASQMPTRFESDVLPYHPQPLIWQTGPNPAITTRH